MYISIELSKIFYTTRDYFKPVTHGSKLLIRKSNRRIKKDTPPRPPYQYF